MGQFFRCCFASRGYTVTCSHLMRSSFTCSVFNCTLLFNLRDIIFRSLDIAAGDCRPLFQKCKIAERLVFIFVVATSFSNGTNVSDKSVYIYTYSYISNCSQIFRYILKKLTYIYIYMSELQLFGTICVLTNNFCFSQPITTIFFICYCSLYAPLPLKISAM